MFESLSERLQGVFKSLRGQGLLSEAHIEAALREIRLALLGTAEQGRRRRHLAERVEPVLREAEQLVASAVQAGATDVLALIDIETRVLEARRTAVQAAYDHALSHIRLAAAAGMR